MYLPVSKNWQIHFFIKAVFLDMDQFNYAQIILIIRVF